MKLHDYIGKISTALVLLQLTLPTAAARAETPLPGPDPEAIWEFIAASSPYTGWQTWAGLEGMQPGSPPHGNLHRIFVNTNAMQASGSSLPPGAIVVKENYNSSEELKAINIMYKIKGYNPAGGDWFWATFDPGGYPIQAGKLRGCIGCHSSRIFNDYIFVKTLE